MCRKQSRSAWSILQLEYGIVIFKKHDMSNLVCSYSTKGIPIYLNFESISKKNMKWTFHYFAIQLKESLPPTHLPNLHPPTHAPPHPLGLYLLSHPGNLFGLHPIPTYPCVCDRVCMLMTHVKTTPTVFLFLQFGLGAIITVVDARQKKKKKGGGGGKW